jgi:hypothetical protein
MTKARLFNLDLFDDRLHYEFLQAVTQRHAPLKPFSELIREITVAPLLLWERTQRLGVI